MVANYAADIDNDLPVGQQFVKQLYKKTMDDIRVYHEHKTSYIDVDLQNQANIEASTVRDYRGRYIFELLQNANDAILAAEEDASWQKTDGYRVRIELTSDALIIANDGVPFLEKDVDSIFRWGESSKDPNKSIGYKGIGFKSVLEITESPQIFSQVVQFWFDRTTCFREIEEIIGVTPDLKLPITRFVFPYPLDEMASDDRSQIDRLLNKRGYATVMRFPLKGGTKRQAIKKQIIKELDPRLLLFLNGIDQIEFRVNGRLQKRIKKERTGHTEGIGQEILLRESSGTESRWLLYEAPKVEIADRELLAELQDNAWERVQKVGFSIALPLNESGILNPVVKQSSRLHVYFPTDVVTGLRFRIHGDFHIDSARKSVGGLKYNIWLTQKIAEYISSAVVPDLLQRFKNDGSILRIFLPIEQPQGFSQILYENICAVLRVCPFIPGIDGSTISPASCLLPPPGSWANLVSFRRFFALNQFEISHPGKAFPFDKLFLIVGGPNFLKTLGATQLTFTDVFRLLKNAPMFSDPDIAMAFYEFLWKWHERTAYDERLRFSHMLSRYRIVLNSEGQWIRSSDRLYHAKLRLETPNMPSCIKADLVHPEAYGAGGREGSTYKLLNSLEPKIRDYDAPAIIRSGVMPLFEGNRFKNLKVNDRAEVYQYLFEYWSTMRGGDTELERLKKNIKVPARMISDKRSIQWLPAGNVYLSSVWSGNSRLENLYKGFDGIYFLYQVPGISPEPEEMANWAQFWHWLGVSNTPRLLEYSINYRVLKRTSWPQLEASPHPHSGTMEWQNYLQFIQDTYGSCQKHGAGERLLRNSIALEGFAALVERGDTNRLGILFELLAEYWGEYGPDSLQGAEVHCRARTYCNVAFKKSPVPTFFQYLLQNAKWIPAHTAVGGKLEAQLYAPKNCWLVSPSEDGTVRSLLPTPLGMAVKTGHWKFFQAIGLRSFNDASLGDLTDILFSLPERYPDPNIPLRTGRRSNPRAISSLTRVIMDRINNLLQQTDDYEEAASLPIIVTDHGQQRYAEVGEAVFFADDRYQSPRWRQYLPLAPLDINMRDAAQFLGIHFISHNVEDRPVVSDSICEAESKKLKDRFVRARPYLLALINDQRAVDAQDIAGLLTRLEVQVVPSLAVERTVTVGSGYSIIDDETAVYLMEESGVRSGSAGRAPRQGTIIVHQEHDNNYDILGAPLANYLRIPGLADAFVILLSRSSKTKRLQYLATRGIAEAQVEAMRAFLRQKGVAAVDAEDELDPNLEQYLIKKMVKSSEGSGGKNGREGKREKDDLPARSGENTSDSLTFGNREEKTLEAIEFPEFDYASVAFNIVDTDKLSPIPDHDSGSRGGKGGRGRKQQPDWERDNRNKDAYGHRGEALVNKMEIQRLRELGIPNPEDYVFWLREMGYEVSDHDLESVDIVDGEEINICIEVKSTPGTDFRVHMSKAELACAQREGENYRLYRVTEVHSAVPNVYVFGNPYLMWQKKLVRIELSDTYVILPNPVLEQ